METVVEGNEVEIHYKVTLEDGTVVDSTDGKEPFKFIAGGDGVIEGVSKAVIGMKAGDKKILKIEPEKGYGKYDEELRAKVARDKVPAEAKVGDTLFDENSENRPWWIKELKDEYAVIDANHPLAGERLSFEMELLSVK